MSGQSYSDTETILESQSFGPLQIRVAILCALAQAFDGYDITSIGMAAPALSHAWGVPAAAFANAFVMSSLGIMVGALASGPIGDRMGRKPVILHSLAFLCVFSLLSAVATSVGMLAVLRFMTGIGIGALMPSTVALAADYTPARLRTITIMWVFTGNTLGGFLGGQLVAQLLPHYGWQVVFLIGGVLPLALIPVLLLMLPESVRFLLTRERRSPRVMRIYAAMGVDPDYASVRHVDVLRGNPVGALFADGYASRTVLLWIMFFANLMSMYMISYWLPSVLHLSGLSPADAVFAASLMSAGAVLSILLLGPLSTSFGPERVLVVSYGGGVVVIAMLALLDMPYGLLLGAIFVMGACTIGSQLAANGLAAARYPARMRTTGVGWALGVGRLGGIAGPALGGALLAMGWPPRQIFLFACVTAAIAATSVALLGAHARRQLPASILQKT
jgi:AAHS family 4-hydroxybenzoate transporter-like MFS transporter